MQPIALTTPLRMPRGAPGAPQSVRRSLKRNAQCWQGGIARALLFPRDCRGHPGAYSRRGALADTTCGIWLVGEEASAFTTAKARRHPTELLGTSPISWAPQGRADRSRHEVFYTSPTREASWP